MPAYKAVHYYENDRQVGLPTEGYFSSDYYTDKMIGWIDQSQQDDEPFFGYISYQAMHYPHQAPLEFIEKYNGVYDEGWKELRDARLQRQKELGIVNADVTLADEFDKTSYAPWQLSDWNALSDEEKLSRARQMQTYAGMLDNMDVNIGRILAHLEELGIADNTLVIFLSDNGADPNQLALSPAYRDWYKEHDTYTYMEDYAGDYTPMGQKGSFADYGPNWAAASNVPGSYYIIFSSEGGIRVPFIARFPGQIGNVQSSEEFAFVKDIVPTVLEVAGVELPGTDYEGKEINRPTGVSMWAALQGKSKTVHEESETIGYELAGSSALFQGKYKLSQNLPPKGAGEWELYDMKADPSEVHNLAAQMPERVAEMRAAYAKYEK